MGDHLTIHRYQWFDRKVRSGCYPNATDLAERFELSKKTAQRCIESLRDRLEAPLEYDRSKKGYFYRDTNFQLPASDVTQEEILAVLVAKNMLSASAGGTVSNTIYDFSKKLIGHSGLIGFDHEKLDELFSSAWHEYAPAQGSVFQLVMRALIDSQPLEFSYTSPQSPEITKRVVEPHHLQHYMGSWILIAFCRLRKRWRKFMLSRMADIQIVEKYFTPRSKLQWQKHLEGGFGIFQGGEKVQVVLRFNSFRASWIKEQVWHVDQKLKDTSGGGVLLSFPACSLHEVKMKVLQFGADVEVIEPEDLRESITEEIAKIRNFYDKN